MRQLNVYLGLNFTDEAYASHSYYQLIEGALKHEGLAPVEEAFPLLSTASLNHTEFLRLKEAMGKAQTYLETVTERDCHKAAVCPWFGASSEFSPAVISEQITAMRGKALPVSKKLDDIFARMELSPDTVALSDLLPLIHKMPSAEE